MMYYCHNCDMYHWENYFCNNQKQYGYYSYKQNYLYKCTCGGEFIAPVEKQLNTSVTTTQHFCPFCNKEMKGLNT